MRVKRFQFGDWQVDAQACVLWREDEGTQVQVEPRALDVLVALCLNAGKILSAEDLLHLCWDGVAVGENQAQKAVAQLRRALGDSANAPRYIENLRKRGYRTIAPVIFAPHRESDALAETWARESPYVGLAPFGAGHASVFFGRDAAVVRLRDVLASQLPGGRVFVLILGASGSGKTSLVQAGLLPALMRAGAALHVADATVLDLGAIGAVPLLTALGGVLLDLDGDGGPLFAGCGAEQLGQSLVEDGQGANDGTAPADGRFVLFVDRLEALFSSAFASGLQRQQFLAALDRLARGGQIMVIAACRNDFYPDVVGEPLLMEAKAAGGHFDLMPPSRAEIGQMIRLPAEIAGLSFGGDADGRERLDDLLCEAAAHSPDALPLLQYTLQQLYLLRSPTRELTLAAYRDLGGIEGAIGRRAETTLEGLSPGAQAALPRIFSLIVALSAIDDAVRGVLARWSDLRSDDERALVQALVDERLFVSRVSGGEAVFGVAHEALLRQWPRAVSWIAEHRQALRVRSQLEGLARQWAAEGRRPDRLLRRGKPLEEARDLLGEGIVPVGPDVNALVTASARHVKRAERLRLGALAAFAAIALVAAFLGLRAGRAEKVAALRLQESEDLADYMLDELADKLRPLGRLDLLDGVAQKALGYLTTDDPDRIPSAARLRQAKALQTLADVDRSRGNVDAALKALGQAESLLQANLREGAVDAETLKIWGTAAFWFGQIAMDQGRLDEALRRVTQYRDFAQRRMNLQPNEADAWIELSYALSSLGTVQLRQGSGDTAADNLDASIALKRRALAIRADNVSLLADLANTLSLLANAQAERGLLGAATDLYDQQRVVLEDVRRRQPDALVWSFRLSVANRLKSALLEAQGKTELALASLDRAGEEIEESLRKEPENQRWQTVRIDIHLQKARIHQTLSIAVDSLSDVLDIEATIGQALRTNPTDTKLQNQKTQALLIHGTALMMGNSLDAAKRKIDEATAIARTSIDHDRQDKLRSILLANTLLAGAEIDLKRGADVASRQACHDAVGVLQAIAPSSKDFRILDPWVRANRCSGNQAVADASAQILNQMGYREVRYLQSLAK
ncbi:winged helix-turn-helix domain-containing protein [Nitrospirillum sp. BR 11163]|uniref:nSTAND1 domain-containing NTPase n=1 Tax=Nitrospirillum sp. BR 11163 TaxID=3104323 RepID=UPI002AFEF0A0|nr:winged helix-turn-helix domain-containing protein [Nitrospirillum sp. BR 11163]MEA1672737.1 winged helix-turn-helix domain-containing protein [Nitrospirillum sp. BR 11163]